MEPSKSRRPERLDLPEGSAPKQPATAQPVWLTAKNPQWPPTLATRLGKTAPQALSAFGNISLVLARKTALFCSARTPGDAILRAHDAARRQRDEGVTVISGFHSPIERECLRILLRGKQPIIVCLARAMETMRIPTECRAAFEAGRLLFLSPFANQPTRTTKESALRRNEVVAALADEAYVAHIESGGKTDRIVRKLIEWKVPML